VIAITFQKVKPKYEIPSPSSFVSSRVLLFSRHREEETASEGVSFNTKFFGGYNLPDLDIGWMETIDLIITSLHSLLFSLAWQPLEERAGQA